MAAGPTAACHILDAAADHYPLAKSMAARMAQLEVDFWQAIHHGRPKAARAHAAKICAMPQPNGKTEFDLRCCTLHCSNLMLGMALLLLHCSMCCVSMSHKSACLRSQASLISRDILCSIESIHATLACSLKAWHVSCVILCSEMGH